MRGRRRKQGRILLFWVGLGLQCVLSAQVMDADSAFEEVREMAAAGSYEEARILSQAILKGHPDYLDVSVYLARICAWEGQYDSALALLEEILEKAPGNIQAYEALVDVNYWENDWEDLKTHAERALSIEPDHAEIRKKYALALRELAIAGKVPEVMAQYYFDHFSEPYQRNWNMVTLGGRIPQGNVVLIPYINGGVSAGSPSPNSDLQFNLDLYGGPWNNKSFYAGYGFSPDGEVDFMPVHRLGAEFWHGLPAGFGLSVGGRFFYWTSPFTFLTLSAEKYSGDYYLSLRSYVFFKEAGLSGSYYLGLRRYLSHKDHFAGLTLGYGTAPDEPVFVESDLDRLNAFSVRAEYSTRIRHNLRMQWGAGYSYEAFDTDEFRHRFDLRIAIYTSWVRWKF